MIQTEVKVDLERPIYLTVSTPANSDGIPFYL